MPYAAQAVAGLVALLLVVGVEIERLAIIGPLQLAVFALHHGPALHHLFALLGEIGGPFLGAVVIAARSAALIFVKNIKRHAVLGGEHVGAIGLSRQKCKSERSRAAKQHLLHDGSPWCRARAMTFQGAMGQPAPHIIMD